VKVFVLFVPFLSQFCIYIYITKPVHVTYAYRVVPDTGRGQILEVDRIVVGVKERIGQWQYVFKTVRQKHH